MEPCYVAIQRVTIEILLLLLLLASINTKQDIYFFRDDKKLAHENVPM